MTYTDLELLHADDAAIPLPLFRRVTGDVGHFRQPVIKLLQKWKIHTDNGWEEEWIEVPENVP